MQPTLMSRLTKKIREVHKVFDKDYEIVIGLEVHVELKTATKIFCSCNTEFGAEPNTQCCPGCMGFPGTLPVLNGKVVDYGIKAGLATNCKITANGKQDRKHYFYPDLPKAYQVSQLDLPLCYEGYIDIEAGGNSKRIGITRIHIEEDAGKLIHKGDEGTLVDNNRGGMPLIEIVSEPDLRSAEEVKAYLQKLRAILLYADISDCKMNEGSFRCDVNLSVRKMGEKVLGTRSETKNLNSFNSIVRAIESEATRQINTLKAGGKLVQETRRWDQEKQKSFSMRTKEDAEDYRYFPDPDLMPIVITDEKIKEIAAQLPELPDARKKVYIEKYNLSPYDAEQLVSSREIADYFERTAEKCSNVKMVANFIMTDFFRLLSLEGDDNIQIPISSENLVELVEKIEDNTINIGISKKIIEEMWKTNKRPSDIIKDQGLEQISDDSVLIDVAKKVIEKNTQSVADYKDGKEKALTALIGQVMRETKGKANPQKVIILLKDLLDK